MTIYAVAVLHYTHTCPSNPKRHIVATQTTVLHTTPGRPCTQPAVVRCGQTAVTVPCHRQVPSEQQCPSCRTVVTVHSTTYHHVGHPGPDEVPA